MSASPRGLAWAFLACGAISLAMPPAAAAPQGGADLQRALGYFKGGKYMEAAAEFQALVDRSPDYDYGSFMLGNCHLKMNRPAEAEAWFRRALELAPGKGEYYYGLALALRAEGRLPDTIAALDRAETRAVPPDARFLVLSLRGRSYAALRRWQESVADLERARAIRPDATVLIVLGQSYFELGRPDVALSAFVDAVRYFPAEPEGYRLGAEALLRLGADAAEPDRKDGYYGDALRLAEAYRRLQPESSAAYNLLGRAALGARRFSDAEIFLVHFLAAEPAHCYAMVNLARAYIAQQKWSPAETTLQKAAACAPKLPVVYETLGIAYLRQQRSAEAVGAFRRAQALQYGSGARSHVEATERSLDGTAPGEADRPSPPNR